AGGSDSRGQRSRTQSPAAAAPNYSAVCFFALRRAVLVACLPDTHLPSVASHLSLPISQPILLFLAAAGWTNAPTAKAARPIATIIERITTSVTSLLPASPPGERLHRG